MPVSHSFNIASRERDGTAEAVACEVTRLRYVSTACNLIESQEQVFAGGLQGRSKPWLRHWRRQTKTVPRASAWPLGRCGRVCLEAHGVQSSSNPL